MSRAKVRHPLLGHFRLKPLPATVVVTAGVVVRWKGPCNDASH